MVEERSARMLRPQSEPAPWAGYTSTCIRQLQQLVMQAVIEHARQLLGRVGAGKIGAADVTDKQCVAGQYGPGLDRLFIIGDHQADALQRVARGFENLIRSFAEAQL